MQIEVITIFPEMFPGVFGSSILKRAQDAGHLRVRVYDLRDYSRDKHRKVDDRPYGGGPGMVLRVEPIASAIEAVKAHRCASHAGAPAAACRTLLLSPQGPRLSPERAQELAGLRHLLLVCGHYEGVDERVKAIIDGAISIGDYVLTGGELPAMVVIDCLARFIPGVIGHEQATVEESFAGGGLEYPQYTRPPVFRDMEVPPILLSGDHERIAAWRQQQSVARTLAARPDLVVKNGSERRST